MLVVFVERLHLLKHLIGYSVQWSHLIRCYRHFDVVQLPNNWLNFRVVNAIEWLNYLQVFFVLFIFFYGCFDWRKVFLVTNIYMVQKWTLSRKESTADLQTFSVPVLAFFLLLRCVKRHVLFHLHDESDLSAVTEVTDSKV